MKKVFNALLYAGALVLLTWCFVKFGFYDYEDYVEGHFPLHLVIYLVLPIAISAVIAHAYEYFTGDDDTWYRRLIRKIFRMK